MYTLCLPLIKGCCTGAGLIMAIGAQNAFVLKQGLLKNHVFVTALFCTVVDALLIALGVGGLGHLFTRSPLLLILVKYAGAAFLLWYGFCAFRSIFKNQSMNLKDADAIQRPSLNTTLLTLAALSFLNPHVYLDTVVLLGSISAQFESHERSLFAFGAMLASFLWFFSLSYGARLLSPLFEKPKSWKILDFLVGCMMWILAVSLLFT